MIPLPERRDVSLERYCTELWQIHEVRGWHADFREAWPTRETFKENWPLLAPDLIVGAWKIQRAHAAVEREEVDYDQVLDPKPASTIHWRERYADELAAQPRLAFALAGARPLSAVIRRARITPLEAEAFRLWAAGTSLSSTARVMGRQKRTVKLFIDRALFKVRMLVEIEEEATG
jgi:DNA-binding CsgD family transcriptional regulator